MRTIGTLLLFWFVLILVYLVLVNFVGATSLLGSIDRTGVDVTKTLQGR